MTEEVEKTFDEILAEAMQVEEDEFLGNPLTEDETDAGVDDSPETDDDEGLSEESELPTDDDSVAELDDQSDEAESDEDSDSDDVEDSEEPGEPETDLEEEASEGSPSESERELTQLRAELAELRALVSSKKDPSEQRPQQAEQPQLPSADDLDLFNRAVFGGITQEEAEALDPATRKRVGAWADQHRANEARYAFDPRARYAEQIAPLVEDHIRHVVAPLLEDRQQARATHILAPLNELLPNTDPRWNGIVEDIKTYQINTLPEAAQRRWIKSQADRIRAETVTKKKPKTTETARKTKAKARKRRGGRRGNAAPSTQTPPAPGMDLDKPFDVEAVAAHFSQN